MIVLRRSHSISNLLALVVFSFQQSSQRACTAVKIAGVKAVPYVAWSSPHPLNFRPPPRTALLLCLGLVIFGTGEALLIRAGLGVSPWTVLAQGLAVNSALGIGAATFLVSMLVLLLWIPLRQVPGLGTLANAVLIAAAIEITLPWLPAVDGVVMRLLQAVGGILLVGLGSGIYLMAHLGAGPRDGLMTGLQRLSGLPIAWVRTGIEVTVVVIGWLLGGTVGIGTLLFALLIGPAVALGLGLVESLSEPAAGDTASPSGPPD